LKKVNLGLIGLGGMGQIHLNNSIRLTDANLLGIADVSKRARESSSIELTERAEEQ